MKFYMMSGCGNRFAIFDCRDRPVRLSSDDVRRIASAGEGANVDQVIAMESSIKADAYARIWNRDGSESEACGNAMRCVGWLLMRQSQRRSATLETTAGIIRTEHSGDMTVAADMNSPLLRWEEIPLATAMDTRALNFSVGQGSSEVLTSPGAVNMGNPHVVFFLSDLDAVDIGSIGPAVERDTMFPRGTNVGFAQILSSDHLRLRVWERGAGLTRACGTGACASVVAACRRGLVGRRVEVITDGGDLLIDWRDSDDHVVMTGPVMLGARGSIGAAEVRA